MFACARPILAKHKLLFKVPARLEFLARLNSGLAQFSQIGKFVTVYPRNDAEAVRLALELHAATRGLLVARRSLLMSATGKIVSCFIVMVRSLQSNSDFEDKYGSLGGSTVIKNCITAMGSVRDAATEFGNPKTLRAALIANPNLLATQTPPAEIYTHTVWLGQRVHETAGKLQSGYQSVLDELPGLPSKDQVEALKAYLFDTTLGPIPLAKQMSDEAGALIKKLGTFEQKMNEYNAKMQAFTAGSSAMMAEVNGAIGSSQQKIQDLEKSRDEAYKAWRDFTIAAVTTSVGCALIGGLLAPFTGGVSLLIGGVAAIATGVGLGVKAAQCRAEYQRILQPDLR